MSFEPHRIRILCSLDHWTPFLREVFEKVLAALPSVYSQLLFCALYDKTWHQREKRVTATPTDFARWIDADLRTVNRCLSELIRLKFVKVIHLGRPSSRTDRPRWEVPLTDFDFRVEGPWTPIPRFFIYEYARAYPRSLLLMFLLWHEHIGWRNDSWPGVTRLARLTGWSLRSVYQALNSMGHERRWEKLGLHLPWPLEIWTRRDNKGAEHRHFHVRAVFYERKRGRGRSVFMFTQEFARYFHVRSGRHFVDLDTDNED